MGGTTAKKNTAWFGYLDAGEKSSAVATDPGLDTGNASTVYLYNLKRNAFLEYKRELVEPKLRELDAGNDAILDELQAAYLAARADFAPRGSRTAVVIERPRARKAGDDTPAKDYGADQEDVDGSDDMGIGEDEADWDGDDS